MAITYFASASTPADGASAVNVTSPTVVTPPASMLAGDLVVMFAGCRPNTTIPAMSQLGGQTWNTITLTGTSSLSARLFWCRYNGTWSANPSVVMTSGTSNSVVMHVFRPSAGANTWDVDVAVVDTAFTAPTTPFTVTATGITTIAASTVSLCTFFSGDDNTWGGLTGTGWVVTGTAQYRNTSGTDLSCAFAHKIQTVAGATGNVTLNQTALGGDAGDTYLLAFKEISAGTNINPGVGALTITGLAPAVIATNNKDVAPGVGQLIITGFASTVSVSTGINVVPGVGNLQITGLSPSIVISDNKNVTPGVGALVVTGISPAVSTTDNKNVSPGVGSLIFTGVAPTVVTIDNKTVFPGVGNLLLTGIAPIVSVGNSIVVSPQVGQLILQGFAPSIQVGVNVFPGTGELILTGIAPVVTVTQNTFVSPGTGELIFIGSSPTVETSGGGGGGGDDSGGGGGTGGGGGSGGSGRSFYSSYASGEVRLTDRELLEGIRKRILQEDEEILLIIKAFLKWQQ